MVSNTRLTDASKLIETVEKSQIPLAEEADLFSDIKIKNARREQLTREEFNGLVKLAEKAKEWEKSVQSSALTEPEETLAG